MAIELREDITGLNDGYKADLLAMLIDQTEQGNIEWSVEYHIYSSVWHIAKLSEKLTAQVTPFDFSMKNKKVQLTQKVDDGEDIKLVITASNEHFEERITKLEKAIFDKLYKQEFTDVFKNVRDKAEKKKDLPKIKFYPNDSYLGKDNLPAIKAKPAHESKPEKRIPHMEDAVKENIRKKVIKVCNDVAQKSGKRKHVKIKITNLEIEVWSDPAQQ